MNMDDLRTLFYPRSVAVIGVSEKPKNLGRNIVSNLVNYNFDGVVYAVGPRGGQIETRRIYKSIEDIPDEVDLAVIITPAKTVPTILEECGEKGIRWAIIETAGFSEYGEEGKKLETEILEISERYGIRFIGPNCIGAMNMENGLCVPFPLMRKFNKRGNVSLIMQSGGVGISALNIMANEGIGLNKFVSVGNMLNIDAEDVLEYLVEDEGTDLIYMYLESIRDGQRLMNIARRTHKPIMIFKANIGALGQNIAISHTGSLTSDDKVVDAAFHQSGIVRVRDATTLGNNLKISRLPPMRGNNLAIISRTGGHAVISADACELSGFNLVEFPEHFLREIEKHFRASVIRLTNPMDLGDLFDLEIYGRILEQTLQQDNVDGIVFYHTSISENENLVSRQLLEKIIALVGKYKKPIAYYLSASAEEISYLKRTYDFPIFTQTVETIRALEINYIYSTNYRFVGQQQDIPQISVNHLHPKSLIETAQREERNLLLSEALDILDDYGIAPVRSVVGKDLEEVQTKAAEIEYPVAIKVISDQITHKSDVGGVQINLRNPSALKAAYNEMMDQISEAYPNAKIDGVLVQPMVMGGHELILGGRQDPQFGPVVVVGFGGVFVEIFDETSVRIAPISKPMAEEMLNSLRGIQILKGARGNAPSDISALVDALLRVSQLLIDFPEIKELDINPLRVLPKGQGCRALDARMILG